MSSNWNLQAGEAVICLFEEQAFAHRPFPSHLDAKTINHAHPSTKIKLFRTERLDLMYL